MKLSTGALFASFFAGSLAIGRVVNTSSNVTTAELPPSQDPWYTAPDNFEDAAPGTVLKIRNASGVVSSVTNTGAAYNLLYRTTDSRYLPTWAVTTLLIPLANISSDNDKLLSYQIPYDSADVDASPSFALNSGGGYSGDGDIVAALGRGWYVNVPDYEGPNASFTAGVQAGHATLDSVRAVLCAENGLLKDPKIALWGYSGGALASEWALELQVQYANTLEFVGAALGGLTPNVTSVLKTINGTVYAGLAPSGILGLSSQYPDLNDYVQGQLNPTGEYNATRFNAAKNDSLIETISSFAGQNLALYFKDGVAALESPIAQRVINSDGIMGYHGVPQFPIFAYKAIGDDISVIGDTDELVNRYCAVGATIKYDRNTVGSHLSEDVNGEARAVAFLTSVLGGTYNATGCQISNVTIGN